MRRGASAPSVRGIFMGWTLQEVLTATGGAVAATGARNVVVSSITTDSRCVESGALFIALRGTQHDGHAFAAEALRRGAAAVMVDCVPPNLAAAAVIRVRDTLRALGDLAFWTRVRHAPRVVAVTGSNGKTTTKEMLAAVCGAAAFAPPRTSVLKTEGNLNNLIGLPLTLLRLRGDEAIAVLEMGMNHPGEIARLTEIARPDFAVITNIGPAHLEGVGNTLAGVAAAKGELFAGLAPTAVVAVNTDDPWVRRLAASFPGARVTFGRDGDVRARAIADFGTDGVAFDLLIAGEAVKVRLPLIGAHNVSNALAAAAIGHALGISCERIAAGLEHTAAPEMRMQVMPLANGVTLINDAYNANPSSVEAALVALRRMPGRRVLVLGEMWELGDESRRAHHAMGERAASLDVDELYLMGTHADAVAAGARDAGLPAAAVHVCGSHAEVAQLVAAGWQSGDTLLVKGSHGMRMDEVVRLLERAGNSP